MLYNDVDSLIHSIRGKNNMIVIEKQPE